MRVINTEYFNPTDEQMYVRNAHEPTFTYLLNEWSRTKLPVDTALKLLRTLSANFKMGIRDDASNKY